MKTYHGSRSPGGVCEVWVSDGTAPRRDLSLRLDLRNHSPTGFEWGYGGSGPAQLALALLADACANDQIAMAHYQEFKWSVVSKLDDPWKMTDLEIRRLVEGK